MSTFKDRTEAGKLLAERLAKYGGRGDTIVLALPRGGVPVGYQVAKALAVPLDVFVVRKLGVPGHEELAMGAIGTGGVRVLNSDVVTALHIPPDVIDRVAEIEQRELERREKEYRDDRPFPNVQGKIAILIDDGLATGSTMRAAVSALRQLSPKGIIVAVPTAPNGACEEFRREVDEVVCLMTPEPFYGVGLWYQEFPQMTDQQVSDLLRQSVVEHTSATSQH
jgi:putative phosphoribosyl transferase